jgi:hypothetical protein
MKLIWAPNIAATIEQKPFMRNGFGAVAGAIEALLERETLWYTILQSRLSNRGIRFSIIPLIQGLRSVADNF